MQSISCSQYFLNNGLKCLVKKKLVVFLTSYFGPFYYRNILKSHEEKLSIWFSDTVKCLGYQIFAYSCNFVFSGLPSLESCPLCDPGQYCDAPGLLQPRAPCDPGYICILGATSSSPTDGVTGSLCPAGGYCVLGTKSSKIFWKIVYFNANCIVSLFIVFFM